VTTVHCLFGHSCPSAIGWFVVSIIVDALNRVAGTWSQSHVGKKVEERRTPAVTDRDSSPAIVPVVRVIGTMTTPHHGIPSLEFGSTRFTVSGSGLESLERDASATLCAATSQPFASSDNHSAAGTLASPESHLAVGARPYLSEFQHGQTSELLAGHVRMLVTAFRLERHHVLLTRGVWPRDVSASPGPFSYILAWGG